MLLTLKCSGEGYINSRIINLFDLIGKYNWDTKVVLVLAAFAQESSLNVGHARDLLVR